MPRPDAHPALLNWQIHSTGLGRALVAWSPHGVSAVFLADDDAALLAELRDTFPDRPCQREDAPHPWVSTVLSALQGGVSDQAQLVSLPLEMRGTPFQLAVWTALRAIPSGQTRHYSELAQQLGRPQAFRAVASACAANVLAVLIPCHRVVRRDGSPSGYRWGVARKQALLAREAAG